MNSFWIPELGGQIYAMPGMQTKLHLIANEKGSFRGSSANLSGRGFAGMKFIAKASSQADFYQWVDSLNESSDFLNLAEYIRLAEPSENNPVASYVLEKQDLYDWIVRKYTMPRMD
jgi:cytochrome o ubiquinol oxidase subunit 2